MNQQQAPAEDMRKRGRANLTWVLLVMTFLAVIAAPTMIVLFFGLLPAMVAYIIDRTPHKSAAITVGSINFIGVFPYVMQLWFDINDVSAAMDIVKDLFALLVMYSAAAFGWLLFLALPTVISSFVVVMHQRKVAQLRGQQKDLIDEWGAEVSQLVEMRRMERQGEHMSHGMSVSD
ncbi:MAG: hypothetical protein HQL36_05480 [Alphaproteobacteria bacterium]|nr:hypothetical protein [Alphaproteobacteria bacterium]MBF0250818.1 hypothetical protein [Alphaproteobacteria bacterium]